VKPKALFSVAEMDGKDTNPSVAVEKCAAIWRDCNSISAGAGVVAASERAQVGRIAQRSATHGKRFVRRCGHGHDRTAANPICSTFLKTPSAGDSCSNELIHLASQIFIFFGGTRTSLTRHRNPFL